MPAPAHLIGMPFGRTGQDHSRPTGCDLERAPCESTIRAAPTPAGGASFPPGGKASLSSRAFVLLACAGFIALYILIDVPEPNELSQAQASVVYYNNGKDELGRFAEVDRTLVDLRDVPDDVQYAVLAAEDRGFYENSGISPSGICVLRGTTSSAVTSRALQRLRSSTHAMPT